MRLRVGSVPALPARSLAELEELAVPDRAARGVADRAQGARSCRASQLRMGAPAAHRAGRRPGPDAAARRRPGRARADRSTAVTPPADRFDAGARVDPRGD